MLNRALEVKVGSAGSGLRLGVTAAAVELPLEVVGRSVRVEAGGSGLRSDGESLQLVEGEGGLSGCDDEF